MFFRSFAIIALASLGFVMALPADDVTLCDVSLSDDQFARFESQFLSDLDSLAPTIVPTVTRSTISPVPVPTLSVPGPAPPVPRRRRVNVYWHVIYAGNSGYLSNAAVASSINALNQHYADTTFTFTLKSITHTQNADWFYNVAQGTGQQTAMKRALHVGGAAALNVYSVSFRGKGVLGYATFPQSFASNPRDDGVVIRWDTVPGGSAQNFNQGKTLTHEVGHWLGLYHVYGGNCNNDADAVSDTPIQRTPTTGCPVTKDSCPNRPGLDSIHNYMDASFDVCRNRFTPGQRTRMFQQTSIYRGIQPS